MNTITIEKVKMAKRANDTSGENTYLISNFVGNFNKQRWYKDELCFVRGVSDDHVSIFRPTDGKVYNLNENSLKNFILLGVII